MKPEELKYTKSHLWVQADGDTASIGISDYAQQELGDIVFVEMPEIGKKVAKDETFGTIESVKSNRSQISFLP
jgi:glycine cleavage system H protein